jgi:alpha-1,2-mannosyltransferase
VRAKRIALASGAVVAMAALSVIWAARQRPGTDFYAKWIAGRWFFTGHPLYVHVPGLRDATYPPFAAFAFQLFALFPLKAAAALFYFANLAFIPVAVVLTRRVADAYWPGRNRAAWPLVAAVVLSAQFILNNLNLVQIDLGLFVLVLAGLVWYAEGRDVRAAAALVLAAAIKLIPIFWVGWLVLRGRRRAALAVLPLGAACLLLPMAQRGPRQGVQDLKDFYGFVLQGFQHGRVIMTFTNQDLNGAVYRLLRPSADPTDRDYRLLPASEATARTVYRLGAGLLLAGFFGLLIWLRLRGAPVTMFELASVFLIGHLLSAMTWKSHLVTLLFVLYPFLALSFRELPRALRWSVYAVLALAAGVGLTGRDVVGDTLHHAIGGYSLIAWMMVALFVLSLALAVRFARQPPAGSLHLVNPDRA